MKTGLTIAKSKELFFKKAIEGTIIVNKQSGKSYIVVENRGESLTAIRAVNVMNPDEWYLFKS